jgi:hypothetical protein
MSEMVSLSRSAFSRGVTEVLTLKPLRDVATGAVSRTKPVADAPKSKNQKIVVERKGGSSWHVKRAG